VDEPDSDPFHRLDSFARFGNVWSHFVSQRLKRERPQQREPGHPLTLNPLPQCPSGKFARFVSALVLLLSMSENAHSSRNTVTWLALEPLSSPASPVYWFSPEKALPAQQSSTTALPLLPSLGTYVQSTGALSTLFDAFELLAKALPASLICAFLFPDSQ